MSNDDEDNWRGHPYLGEPLINPQTGRLQDYERFPGDEPPSFFHKHSESDRWGRRVLMAINQPDGEKVGPVDTQILVDIRTIKRTIPIDFQLRFALVAPDGTPIVPFSPVWPFASPGPPPPRLLLTVRRTSDQLSVPTEDVLEVSDSAASRVFPWDIFTSKTFYVEAAFSNGIVETTPGKVWVEAIATQVADVSTRNRIEGWGVSSPPLFIPAVASPAGVQALQGRADRRQFFVSNTSTNADLWVGFGSVDPSTNSGALVLPPGTTYESPVGGYTGNVWLSWNAAVPNGGALVTEGVFGVFPGNRIQF